MSKHLRGTSKEAFAHVWARDNFQTVDLEILLSSEQLLIVTGDPRSTWVSAMWVPLHLVYFQLLCINIAVLHHLPSVEFRDATTNKEG